MTDDALTRATARPHDELYQPSISARLLEPFTRQLFLEAGIEPGMRVLDVWSGAGDVAILARELVGPEGYVVGFDSSAQMVAFANEHAARLDLGNVEFVESQVDELRFGADFDAIIGRVVLAYRPDPVRDLQALVRYLRRGGLLVFQEPDSAAGRTTPPSPVVDEIRAWVIATFERVGIEIHMGSKLYATFAAAGLEPPRMRLDGLIGGAESLAPLFLANIVRVLLPKLEALGVASLDDIQIETLEERVRDDLARNGAVMQSPLMIGAWTRLRA